MSPSRKRKTCSADDSDELMAEFRRLRDETQPIREGIAALSPFQNPRGDLSTDTSLLRELQLMRTEMKTEMKQIQNDVNEMKENLEKIRVEVAEVKNNQELSKMEMAEVKNNQEVLKNDQCNLSVQMALLKKDLKANQEVLMNNVRDNASNLNIVNTKVESVIVQINVINEKVSKLKCQPTFREQISGKWKIDNAHKSIILSLKFNDNQFILQRDSEKQYVYILDVLDSEGEKVELKGERIVHSWEDFTREYYLDDGKLKVVEKEPGNPDKEYTFKRIGDPDPE